MKGSAGAAFFIAKYAADGQLVWARQAGGVGGGGWGAKGLAIAVDSAGTSYVTGLFAMNTTFGLGEVNETTLTTSGSVNLFVAKYGSDGQLMWATQTTGNGSENSRNIVIDGFGNSYVTGSFSTPCFIPCPATFGPGEINETLLAGDGEEPDIFVAKYNGSGTLLWAKRAGGAASETAFGIGVDGGGNSYVTGSFGALIGDEGPFTATFGEGEVNETTLTSAAWSDHFLAKYDAAGALVWLKQTFGTGFDVGYGIGVDSAGGTHVTGFFGVSGGAGSDTSTFGLGEANETILVTSGGDMFVARYDGAGSLLGVTQAAGARSADLAIDTAANSYITGHFRYGATFGAGGPNETTLTAFGNFSNIFVAKYSNNAVSSLGPVSALPASGGGATQTFTFTFGNPTGWQNLQVVNVLINDFLDGRNACYIAYVPINATTGTVLLVNDAGDSGGPYSQVDLPSGQVAANSQCTINGGGSSATAIGNTLTLTLAITFNNAFAGDRIVYMAAGDKSANSSGWHALGTWLPPDGLPLIGPNPISVNPARSLTLGHSYTFVFEDTLGWQDLGILNILINDFLDGRNACYLAYSRAADTLFLVNDAGNGLLPGEVLDGSGTLGNSQCTVNLAGTTAVGGGNTLTLTLNMGFPAGFSGDRVIYTAARSNGDVLNSGWKAKGSVTVP